MIDIDAFWSCLARCLEVGDSFDFALSLASVEF